MRPSQSARLLHGRRWAEQKLLEGLRRGEEAAYRQLYDHFAPRLERTIIRLYRDPALAFEAVQETFLKVFRKIDQFNEQSSLLTWMTRIGIREAAHLGRRQAHPFTKADLPGPEAHAKTPEQHSAERQLYLQLDRLIAALPIEKRTVLLLFEVEGLSAKEIAEITGEPRGTVLARLSRTRAELREALTTWSTQGLLDQPEPSAGPVWAARLR